MKNSTVKKPAKDYLRQRDAYKRLKALVEDFEDGEPGTGIACVSGYLRHLCDEFGLNFGELDKQGYQYYLAEA